MQIYSKNNKNCFFLISWPIFILFVLSDRARWRLQNLYTKFWNTLIMLIYANLRSPGRDPGVQSAFFFFFFFFYYYYYYFFFFMSLPGRHIYIFLTLIFLFLVPSRGIKCLFFWPVENCTTWNLRYLMLRDAGWALRHWRSCLKFLSFLFAVLGSCHGITLIGNMNLQDRDTVWEEWERGGEREIEWSK